MLSYSDIFIATPTHICKRYCAGAFSQAVREYGIKNGCGQLIVCNSYGDAKRFYENLNYHRLPELNRQELHDNPEAIHRRITDTMNYMREIFLLGNWEIFLSLEADVLLEENTLAEILYRFNNPGSAVGHLCVLHTNCYHGFNVATEYGFTERLTLGCTAIKRDVIKHITFRYEPTLLAAHHDALFAHDCIENGIPMLYDPFIVTEHMHNGKGSRGWQELPRVEVHG